MTTWRLVPIDVANRVADYITAETDEDAEDGDEAEAA